MTSPGRASRRCRARRSDRPRAWGRCPVVVWAVATVGVTRSRREWRCARVRGAVACGAHAAPPHLMAAAGCLDPRGGIVPLRRLYALDHDGRLLRAPLKKTSLHATHVALGARMVPFAGWDMPVEYSGITAEHLAVRTAAGLFDVSHMGEIEMAGKDALAAVQHISSNDASRLQVGQAHYSALTTPDGTFVDDMLVYRFAPNHFLLVVNGSNIDKDYAWIAERVKRSATRRSSTRAIATR